MNTEYESLDLDGILDLSRSDAEHAGDMAEQARALRQMASALRDKVDLMRGVMKTLFGEGDDDGAWSGETSRMMKVELDRLFAVADSAPGVLEENATTMDDFSTKAHETLITIDQLHVASKGHGPDIEAEDSDTAEARRVMQAATSGYLSTATAMPEPEFYDGLRESAAGQSEGEWTVDQGAYPSPAIEPRPGWQPSRGEEGGPYPETVGSISYPAQGAPGSIEYSAPVPEEPTLQTPVGPPIAPPVAPPVTYPPPAPIPSVPPPFGPILVPPLPGERPPPPLPPNGRIPPPRSSPRQPARPPNSPSRPTVPPPRDRHLIPRQTPTLRPVIGRPRTPAMPSPVPRQLVPNPNGTVRPVIGTRPGTVPVYRPPTPNPNGIVRPVIGPPRTPAVPRPVPRQIVPNPNGTVRPVIGTRPQTPRVRPPNGSPRTPAMPKSVPRELIPNSKTVRPVIGARPGTALTSRPPAPIIRPPVPNPNGTVRPVIGPRPTPTVGPVISAGAIPGQTGPGTPDSRPARSSAKVSPTVSARPAADRPRHGRPPGQRVKPAPSPEGKAAERAIVRGTNLPRSRLPGQEVFAAFDATIVRSQAQKAAPVAEPDPAWEIRHITVPAVISTRKAT